MADSQHLSILHQGIEAWNEWRKDNPLIKPQLKGARLDGMKSRFWNLRDANLEEASIANSILNAADLSRARLARANLNGARMGDANLSEADCRSTQLRRADLGGATLYRANVQRAEFYETLFVDTDLREVQNLDNCVHGGPSNIDHRTLTKSGRLPLAFLRGCGLPKEFIENIPALFWEHPLQFFSCFISYSHADKEFARNLEDALQQSGVRCWLDEKQLKPGDDIYEEVDRGIRLRDKVLLCCSETSLSSWWVDNEIGTTLDEEQRSAKEHGVRIRTLIPLDLDGFLFSSAVTNGFASQLRRRHAADFNEWKTNEKKFKSEIVRLVRALETNGASSGPLEFQPQGKPHRDSFDEYIGSPRGGPDKLGF